MKAKAMVSESAPADVWKCWYAGQDDDLEEFRLDFPLRAERWHYRCIQIKCGSH